MKVQADGREYWIEFLHLNHETRKQEGFESWIEVLESTTCLLRDGSAPREKREDAPIVAQGRVKRYFKDTPNREVARKQALSKALKDLDVRVPAVFNVSVFSRQSSVVSEEEPAGIPANAAAAQKVRRRLFWTAYLYRKSPVASSQSSVPKSSGN